MSKAGDLIMVDGYRDLKVAFQRTTKEIEQAAMQEYSATAWDIIGEAQMNLRRNGSVATAKLRNSGRVEKVDEHSLDVGFFANDGDGYAYFVEYGRRAGKMPPIHFLEEWMHKKHTATNGKAKYSYSPAERRKIWGIISARIKDNDTSPYLVPATFAAWRIHKQGTKPHPFFTPAVQKYKGRIKKALTRAINKVTR